MSYVNTWEKTIPEKGSLTGSSQPPKMDSGNGKGPCAFYPLALCLPLGTQAKEIKSFSPYSSPSSRCQLESGCLVLLCRHELSIELRWHQPQLKKPGGLRDGTGFPAQHDQSLAPVDSASRSGFSFQSGMW